MKIDIDKHLSVKGLINKQIGLQMQMQMHGILRVLINISMNIDRHCKQQIGA